MTTAGSFPPPLTGGINATIAPSVNGRSSVA